METRNTELCNKIDLILDKLATIEHELSTLKHRATKADMSTQTDNPKINNYTQTETYSTTTKPTTLQQSKKKSSPPSNLPLSSSQPSSKDTPKPPTPTPTSQPNPTITPSLSSTTGPQPKPTSTLPNHPKNYNIIARPPTQPISIDKLQRPRSHLKNILNRRKLHFYQHLRSSELAEIYEQNLKMEPPRIPRKLREYTTPQDSVNAIRRKRSLECIKLQHLIDNLKEQAQLHQDQLRSDDTTASNYISSLDPLLTSTLQKEWHDNCHRQETISVEIWSRKRLFFTSDRPYQTKPQPTDWQLVQPRNRRFSPPSHSNRPFPVFRRSHFPPPRLRQPTLHPQPPRYPRPPTHQPHQLPKLMELRF